MYPDVSKGFFHGITVSVAVSLILSVGQTATGQFTMIGEEVRLPRFPLYQQPDDISCGPTAAAMVLSYYGKESGIGPLKTDAGTRWIEAGNRRVGMTHPTGLCNAMTKRGVPAELRRGSTSDLWSYVNDERPVILLVRSGRDSWHYVVVTGYIDRGREYWIHDPGAHAPYTRSAKVVQQAWQFSHDLNGNYIPDVRCDVCAGSGEVNKPGINLHCVVCNGSGKIRGQVGPLDTGLWTTCPTCGGSGRMRGEVPRIPCPACFGKGNFGDPIRKAVESFVSGNMMIVPALSPNQITSPSSGVATRSWSESVSMWSVTYEANRSETVTDTYQKVGPSVWERTLMVVPHSTRVAQVKERYQLTETGVRGDHYLDLDDARTNQVIRIFPDHLDIFQRSEGRWAIAVYDARNNVIHSR